MMIEKFKEKIKGIWKTEGQENIKTPVMTKAVFLVTLSDSEEQDNGLLHIGTLLLKEGNWIFEYSRQFKEQDVIKPLVDFPDINKVYKSSELYPFFMERIPSLSQPKVQKTLEKEKIDSDNPVQLLKRFGKTTITNPFELEFQM